MWLRGVSGWARTILLAVVVGTGVLGGLLGQQVSTRAAGAARLTAAPPPRTGRPRKHTLSYTTGTYARTLRSTRVPLARPGTKPPRRPVHVEAPKPKTTPKRAPSTSVLPRVTPAVATDSFAFFFSANSPADATNGVQVLVCVTADDDTTPPYTQGLDVYLTANSGGVFLPSLVTMAEDDVVQAGCATSTLFVPATGTVTMTAAVYYITPDFNVAGGSDEYGEYPLPSSGAAQIDIATPSAPAAASIAYGQGHGTSPMAAEPVNLAIGNYTYQHTDVSLPIRDRTLLMERTYNSLSTAAGPLGVGWTFTYDQSITFPSASEALVTYADGHTEHYTLAGGVYTPDPGTGVLSTLVQNGDGTYTVTRKDGSQDHYSSGGKLLAIIDRNGAALTLSYDGSGNLTAVADGSGRGLTFAYDGSGRITTVTDPLGLQVSYAYDAGDDLSQVTDPLGLKSAYTYDGAHRLLTITDPLGYAAVTNAYDATSGRVVQQTDAAGSVTTFAYNGNATTVTDPRGHATTYAFDFFYRQISVTDALGGVADTTYDANGEVTSVTDPDSDTTLSTYDGAGNLTSVEDAVAVAFANPAGRTTTYTYDGQDRLLTQTDANGNTVSYAYDGNGNMLSMTDPLGGVTTFTYDQYGERTGSTGPDGGGHTSATTYDTYGDPVATRDGMGDVRSTTYDADGRPVTATDPDGHATTTSYDADGRILAVRDALGHTTSYTYDGNGNRLSLRDAGGNLTTYVYDKLDRLVRVNNPDGSFTQYAYDANGNRTQVTDGDGHTTTSTYDADNRLLTRTDPLGRATGYTYDPAGNPITITDGRNLTTQYFYDQVNELVNVIYADNSSVSLSYDGVGNRFAMADATGSTSYSYDQLNRLVEVLDPAGRAIVDGYDAESNRTSISYPDGQLATYTYDNADRLHTATDGAGRTTTYGYDRAGNVVSEALPSGVVASYLYDADNQILQVTNAIPAPVQPRTGGPITPAPGPHIISQFRYSLDATERRVGTYATGANVEAGGVTDSYDAMGRLVGATYPDGSKVAYAYDGAGNRTSMAVTARGTTTSTSYVYDAADELQRSTVGATTTNYTYDNAGDLTGRTTGSATTGYQFNAAGELATVTSGATTVQYTYNGDGSRVATATTTGATTITTQDVLSPGKVPQVAEELVNGGVTDEFYGLDLIASEPGGGTSQPIYYLYDGLGSVRDTTDAHGNVLGSASYDAFGAVRKSAGAAVEWQLGGQQVDVADGLTYLRARYYDPTLGRFISRDSTGVVAASPMSLNAYVYCGDDPVNLVDLDGHWALWDDALAIGGGFVVGTAVGLFTAIHDSNGPIDWGRVAGRALTDGVIGAAAGEAALYAVPALAAGAGISTVAAGFVVGAGIGGVAGGVQGAADYCWQSCYTNTFSEGKLWQSGEIGAASGLVGGLLTAGIGPTLSNLGGHFDSDVLSTMGDYFNGDEAPSWWPGSAPGFGNGLGTITGSFLGGALGLGAGALQEAYSHPAMSCPM